MGKNSQRKAAAQARQKDQTQNTPPQKPMVIEKANLAASQSVKATNASPAKAVPASTKKKGPAGMATQVSYVHVASDIKWVAATMAAMFVLLVILSYALK